MRTDGGRGVDWVGLIWVLVFVAVIVGGYLILG